MYLMKIGGILVCCSLWMSVCMWIVSKAFVMSSDVVIVRVGGFFWLKPEAMVLLILWSAVVVECSFLKPC